MGQRSGQLTALSVNKGTRNLFSPVDGENLVEVEKRAAGNHEVDETTVTRHRREQLPNAPMISMLASVPINTLVDDHVIITKPPVCRIFGTNISGEACCKISTGQRLSLDLVLSQPTIC
ncbi:hypothetical protein Godav_003181 [Gossypium davidsonii]|uniref:Uncharacterized protein n=1 Tax=Gossypium davidsonii TaxID=34287 RepID=A0A7J8T052_GOSDV|nr:hypothetical protein [Gossypium davidsonii]